MGGRTPLKIVWAVGPRMGVVIGPFPSGLALLLLLVLLLLLLLILLLVGLPPAGVKANGA